MFNNWMWILLAHLHLYCRLELGNIFAKQHFPIERISLNTQHWSGLNDYRSFRRSMRAQAALIATNGYF